MTTREKLLIGTIALVAGVAGGVLSRWIPTVGRARVQEVIAANEFLVIDKDSKGYAIFGIDKGEPKLRFYRGDNKEIGRLGIANGEPELSLQREDGSLASLGPNDEGPGWHFMLLKSLGEGQGVYMSMLTADDLSIYQSKVGSVAVGNLNGQIKVNLKDANDKTTWESP